MYLPSVSYLCVMRLSSCCINHDKYLPRLGRTMQKLMKGSLHKTRNWHLPNDGNNLPLPPTNSKFYQGAQSSRRVSVLNKIFMKNITDLMATGEVSEELLGLGISISKVKVTQDFQILKVYWIPKGDERDVEIERILSTASYSLRHELSRLCILGNVPIIQFVRDNKHVFLSEVDSLLQKADKGNDCTTQDPSTYPKSEFTMRSSSFPDIKNSVEDVEEFPQMPNDILGLNHEEIMKKIKKSVKKSAALQRKVPAPAISELETYSSPEIEKHDAVSGHISERAPMTDIGKFIVKREIMKKKALTGLKNYQPEREFPKHMRTEDTLTEEWVDDTDDFIEEFDEKYDIK